MRPQSIYLSESSVFHQVRKNDGVDFRGVEQQQSEQPPNPQAPPTPTWQHWARPLQIVPQVLGQHANVAQMTQDLQQVNAYGGGELLSLLGPRTATVAPWLGPGYIGLDVYNQARQTYAANAALEQQQRVKETAIKTGDAALVHGLASVGIPLLLTKQVSRGVDYLVEKPAMPVWLARHPKWITTAAMFGLMVVLAKPIQAVTNFVLNWTYRPLLERKRREEVQKILQKQLDRQMQWFQTQPLLNPWRNPLVENVNNSAASVHTTASLS